MTSSASREGHVELHEHVGQSRRDFLAQAAALASVPVLGGVLAACGSDSSTTSSDDLPGKASGSVLFWADDEPNAAHFRSALQANPIPNVEVDVQVGEQDSTKKTLAALAAGEPPDVMDIGRWQYKELASRGAIYTLDDRIDSASTWSWDDVYSRLQEEDTWMDQRWIVPHYTGSRALYYNEDLLEQAGLDPESLPTTWQELTEQALEVAKLNGDSVDVIGFTPTSGNPAGFLCIFSALSMLESGIVNEDQTEVTLLEKGPQAMELLKGLIDDQGGYAAVNNATGGLPAAESVFATGKVALEVNGPWELTIYDKQKLDFSWGVAPTVPYAPMDTVYNYDGGSGFIIFQQANNAEGGWAFIEWAMEEKELLSFCNEIGAQAALVPVNEMWAQENSRNEVFAQTTDDAAWPPVIIGFLDMLDILVATWDQIMFEKESIDDALGSASEQIQQILDQSNSNPPPEVVQL